MATCEAIINCTAVDPQEIAANFTRWFRSRRFTGLGSMTLKALRDLDVGAHWALAGGQGEFGAGNGAAMRIAPLAFALNPEDREPRTRFRDVCRITHRNEEAYVGALAIATGIRILAKEPSAAPELCRRVAGALPDSSVRDRLEELAPLKAAPSEIASIFGASGYVVESVPLVLHAAQRTAEWPFNEILESALAAGGDTDTIGAMTGQLAGTYLGVEALPADLLDWVVAIDWIKRTAEAFADQFGA